MRIAMALLTGLILITSCKNAASDGYTVEGHLSGELADGTRVILRKNDETMRPVDVDTALTDKGNFVFIGSVETPELYYVFVEGLPGGIPLILENGTIEIEAHKDSLQRVTLGGSPQNDAYFEYLDGARQMADLRQAMNDDMRMAMMKQDTAVMTALRDEYFELVDRMNSFEQDFVSGHPDALISALILERMVQSNSLPVAEIEALHATLSPEIKDSERGNAIASRLESVRKTAIGQKAPEFSAPTPDGEELALKDALGKITLVDFWAAWCRPCRAENPNIVSVYNKYKDKGFQVLGVSLDRNAEDWKRAIEDDGLTWNHVSNVQYFDEIADLYNVRAIPASFILDENGVILAKNLRGPELEAKIAELLP